MLSRKTISQCSASFKQNIALLYLISSLFVLIGCGGGAESSDGDDSKNIIPCTSISSALPAGSVTLNEKIKGSTPFAVRITDKPIWQFTVNPSNAEGILRLELKRDDGETVCVNVVRDGNSFIAQIKAGELESGYYDVNASFQGANDWTGAFIVVDGDAMHDVRFGVDAGLSWPLETSVNNQLDKHVEAMKLIGFGSVRDRLTIENTIGWNCNEEPIPPKTNLHLFAVAKMLKENGLEIVQTISYGLPSKQCNAEGMNLDAAYKLGQVYARTLGDLATSVEYINEPVAADFFEWYPFQYASALKEFTAGVKSVNPNIRVLAASLAGGTNIDSGGGGYPPLWEQSILMNNIKDSFDIRNEHWYPPLNNTKGLIAGKNIAAKLATDAQAGVGNKARWLTEMGYVPVKTAADERLQAAYTVETYAAAFGAGIERAFIFYWQTLLERCGDRPHTTDNCSYVFGLTRFEKSDIYADGRSQIFSPRPALSAAAAVIRHLQGKQVLKQEATADGATVYFEGGTAITWDSSRALSSYGSGVIVKNMYGRVVANATNIKPDSQNPYLLSNVSLEPNTPQIVITPSQPVSQTGATFRIEALSISINDEAIKARSSNSEQTVKVKIGDIIALKVRARAGTNSDVSDQTTFQCRSLESSITVDASASGLINKEYVCIFKVIAEIPLPYQPTVSGNQWQWVVDGFVGVNGTWQGNSDLVWVGLSPDLPALEIAGNGYDGQTVKAITAAQGVTEYRWSYKADNSPAPGANGDKYTISAADFYANDEGQPIQVEALDSFGYRLGYAWFRPTKYRLKGWIAADDLQVISGKVHIAAAWAFDWADTSANGRMLITVGADCAAAAPNQRYGLYIANATTTIAAVYPQFQNGTYWFENLDIPVAQTGNQSIYLYAVPHNWNGSCTGAAAFSGGGFGKTIDLGSP